MEYRSLRRKSAAPGTFAGLFLLAALVAPPPAGAQPGTWSVRSPMPTPRRLLAAAALGGRVYTFGGCGSPCFQPPFHTSTFEETRVEVYDPARDSWGVLGRMPTILFGAAAAAPGEGKIYTVGGFVSGNVVQEYDPAADSWALKAPMPTARHGLAAVALGGKVYALGGSAGDRASGALEVYDPRTDSWEELAPMPTPRVFLAAAVLEGRIYALGGSPDCCGESQTDVVEVYDPETDSWGSAAPLPLAQQVSAAAALNGRLLTFGGFVPGEGAHGRTFEYDPLTGRWSERAPMPTPRDQAPAVATNPQAFVPGGSTDCHCRALDDNEGYTPRPPAEADLEITKTDTPDPVGVGGTLTYALVVRNRGPGSALGLSVRDELPAEVALVAAGGEGWSCTPGTQSVACTRPALAPGEETPPIFLDVRAPARPGEILNTAEVSSDVRDPRPDDNRAEEPTTVVADADVGIVKTNSADVLTDGAATVYEITVRNSGPDPAFGIRVRDDLPPELRGGRWTCTGERGGRCSSAGAGDIDDLADLPAGGSVTYRLHVVVDFGDRPGLISPPEEATVTNEGRAEVPPGVADPDPDNNTASDTDPVVSPSTDLAISKSVEGDTPILAGGAVVFTVVARNLGPQDVQGARVRDLLPAAFESASWTCEASGRARCTPSGAGDVDDRVDLAVGGTLTYTVTAKLRSDYLGPLFNTASVAPPPGARDPAGADNASTVSATVFPSETGVRAVKSVGGNLFEGGEVTYTLTLLSSSTAEGETELRDVAPEEVLVTRAEATSGELLRDGNELVWNGTVEPFAPVTITVSAEVTSGAAGTLVCNQATVDGSPSDDPETEGPRDETCFTPISQLRAIPTLSSGARALLTIILLVIGVCRLRRW